MKLSDREIVNIIHGLMLFKEDITPRYGKYGANSTIAPIFDEVVPMTAEEIKKLCGKLAEERKV